MAEENFQISIYGKNHTINLDHVCPEELMETNFKKQSYISISVIREISRVKGWKIGKIWVSSEQIDWWATTMFSCYVTINIDWEELNGMAADTYPTKQLAKTCFPNVARIQALAVKNALKWKYRFFEADLLTAEQVGEKGLDVPTIATGDESKWVKESFISRINAAITKVQLAQVSDEIRLAYESKKLSSDDKAIVQAAYNKKYWTL